MSQYLIDLGTSLSNVLERASSTQPEVFAGYVANLGFWCDEYDHLCAVHAGHEARLETMKEASTRILETRGEQAHDRDDVGIPRQQVKATTTGAGRTGAVRQCRNALGKIVERAVDLELLDDEAGAARLARVTAYRL